MGRISLKGRVALITGAGRGLGREHALYLARLGARIVVNDLGGTVHGEGSDTAPAAETVTLIRQAGGEAVVDGASVETMEGAHRMVETALKSFGRLDIVVNNAGILKDASFAKQDDEAWERVLSVHLTGSRNVTQAVWKIFCDQKFGRVVMTTSASGLYGNFGQSNYAAAKLGILGLVHALKEEGMKYGIRINAIAPMARSRMTESILPVEVLERLDPRHVSPVVAYFSSEACRVTGQCWSVGAGVVARAAVVESPSVVLEESDVDSVAAQVDRIEDLTGAVPYANLAEAAAGLLAPRREA